jgi:hypothetical protein
MRERTSVIADHYPRLFADDRYQARWLQVQSVMPIFRSGRRHRSVIVIAALARPLEDEFGAVHQSPLLERRVVRRGSEGSTILLFFNLLPCSLREGA